MTAQVVFSLEDPKRSCELFDFGSSMFVEVTQEQGEEEGCEVIYFFGELIELRGTVYIMKKYLMEG